MQQLYSVKAYHSTRQKGLKKFESRTTTATIDTGEGAHVHGWGLYLQADEMENRRLYLDAFTGNASNTQGEDYHVKAWGKEFDVYCSEDVCGINDAESFTPYDFENAGLTDAEELYITLIINGYTDGEIGYILNEVLEKAESVSNDDEYDEIPEILLHWDEDTILEVIDLSKKGIPDYEENVIARKEPDPLPDGTHYEQASQYTVEIPDDMVFIDEDKQVPDELVMTFVDTFVSVHTDYDYHGTDKSFYGKKNYSCKDIAEGKFSAEDVYIPNNCPEYLEELLRTRQKEFVEDLYGKRKAIINNVITDNGRSFYSRVSRALGGEEKASLWLSEHGIDGMTYEGGRDHGCFVIYNCDKLKIVAEY